MAKLTEEQFNRLQKVFGVDAKDTYGNKLNAEDKVAFLQKRHREDFCVRIGYIERLELSNNGWVAFLKDCMLKDDEKVKWRFADTIIKV